MGDDLFEIDATALKKAGVKRKGAKDRSTMLFWAMMIGFGLVLVFKVYSLVGGPINTDMLSGSGSESARTTALSDDEEFRKVTRFVSQFLFNYYNRSYNMYPQASSKAAAMMTPALRDYYVKKALDRDFTLLLERYRVSTDAFRVSPDSIRYKKESDKYYVLLSGAVTFTTTTNGAQHDYPVSLALEVVNTPTGMKVNNVERTQ